jgi:hypothetical protein
MGIEPKYNVKRKKKLGSKLLSFFSLFDHG